MKRLTLFIFVVLIAYASASAQKVPQVQFPEPVDGILPGMKYSKLKKLYDYKDYTETYLDVYNPRVMGAMSYFIPGMGHIACGEVGRGLAWLGSTYFFGMAGMFTTLPESEGYPATAEEVSSPSGQDRVVLSIALMSTYLAFYICNIVDAVRVAKVKNMYHNDLFRQMYSYDVDIYPSLNYTKTAAGVKPTAGVTLAFRF
jgi:hypothetical protein